MKSITAKRATYSGLSGALILMSVPLVARDARAGTLDKSFAAQPFLDTSLGGTTSAARPELAGLVLEDQIQPFSFSGVTGTVQNRVVREDGTGTLDFYWRIQVDPAAAILAPGGISAFRLGSFGYGNITDADWRIDGLGSAAPYVGRVFNPSSRPEGDINFLFSDGLVHAGDPADSAAGSRFFFLHTDATTYARTATYDLLDAQDNLSSAYATFAPSETVPDGGATCGMLLMGLAGVALGVRR